MKLFSKSQNKIILTLILLVAFWYRIQGFLHNTFAFTYDVGRDFLAVSNMLSEHKPLLIGATTGLHGVFYGPTWYYIMTPFFILTGGDPRGIAFFMAISGVLTAFLGYLVGNSISGKALGLTLAFFIGISEILNQISAQIWNPNLIPVFVMLVYILILKNESKKMAFLLGIVLGIIFDLELVFGLIFLIAAIIYIISFRHFKRLSSFGLLIGGFILIQLPRVVFELRHNFLMTKTFINAFSVKSSDSLLSPMPNFSKVLTRIFQVFSDTLSWQNIFFGLGVLVFISFVSFYFYKKFRTQERVFLNFTLVVISAFLICLSFFKHEIESHYYIGIPVIFVSLLGFSIFIFRKYTKINKLILGGLILFFALVLNQLKLADTFLPSNWVGDASVYRNQLEVVNYIYNDAAGEKFDTITYTPPIYDYTYQYLFRFYGKKKFGYTPSQNHEKNFYLILEPDLQFPQRLADWLSVRKKDGVIVSEKEFPSGIIVQKRFH